MDKCVFCKDSLGVFPDALQLWTVDAGLLFLGQDAHLIAVVQIQTVHLGFPEEYLEENLENTFSRTAILGAISFRRILSGRVFSFIQP